jgi:hypothetical protein
MRGLLSDVPEHEHVPGHYSGMENNTVPNAAANVLLWRTPLPGPLARERR